MRTYRHTFTGGSAGGWLGWRSNSEGASKLPIVDGAACSSSPWWIDYNHAPPGAGYLHLLYCLHTAHGPGFSRQCLEAGGENHFVTGGFPRDFRDARVTFVMKGELDLRGARALLLAQAQYSSLNDLNAVSHEDARLAGRLLGADRELADAAFDSARVAAAATGNYPLLKYFLQYSFIKPLPVLRGE